MRASEMREMSGEELQRMQEERQNDLLNFRLQEATGVVENTRASREARKDIARIKTILRERESQEAKGKK